MSDAKTKTAKQWADQYPSGKCMFGIVDELERVHRHDLGYTYAETSHDAAGNPIVRTLRDLVHPRESGVYEIDMARPDAVAQLHAVLDRQRRNLTEGLPPALLGPYFDADPAKPKDKSLMQWVMDARAKALPKTPEQRALAAEADAKAAMADKERTESQLKQLLAERDKLLAQLSPKGGK